MGIGPHDLLDVGTKVRVGNLLGEVIKAEMLQAVPCGEIAVHTIKYTHRRKRMFGATFRVEELALPTEGTTNYSFIEVEK